MKQTNLLTIFLWYGLIMVPHYLYCMDISRDTPQDTIVMPHVYIAHVDFYNSTSAAVIVTMLDFSHELRILDLDGKKITTLAGLPEKTKYLKAVANGSLLAVGSNEGTITFLDSKTGTKVFEDATHEHPIACIKQIDADLIMVIDKDGYSSIYNIKTFQRRSGGRIAQGCRIYKADGILTSLGVLCAIAVRNQYQGDPLSSHYKELPLLSDYHVKRATIHRLHDGKIQTKLIEHRKPIESIQFSPDGRHVMTAAEDNVIKVWNPLTGRCMHAFDTTTNQYTLKSTEYFQWPYFITLARSEREKRKEVKIWEAETTGMNVKTIYFCDPSFTRLFHAKLNPDTSRLLICSGSDTYIYSTPHMQRINPSIIEQQRHIPITYFADGASIITKLKNQELGLPGFHNRVKNKKEEVDEEHLKRKQKRRRKCLD